ncbi:hypothetical protein NBRGN_021_00070 [Nocardia brasiliensis NBRC 14402]|uniref:hypothetical protein n=1 Tax=Nocardia brasiliensis TaxID=37326 RepID=UPI00031573F9|nr:hypothetical protein [Nocardia brasiliensis]ASF07575.1 hypothetical protein CEQ30_09625 [Nocardia brasiliensis]GAJ80016.1 hypothetical protein NBRGN_021_00070 [Nocardia brasiliensis NBRC 14402]SUB54887.1 Uncharacterised protein [Nocardia brasiliensis]
MTETPDPTATLRRWADSGAIWRVLARTTTRVTVGLFECTGGQEVDRITSTDPALLRFLGDRWSSED